jgi:hypothetical protein
MAMKKKNVDWVALELAYRTGRSFRVLAREFGISATRIKQVADEENWARDLSAIIAEKARAKLNAANLNSNLNGKIANERAIVDATVQVQTNIVLEHRRDIQRGRDVVIHLLQQLENQVGTRITGMHPASASAAGDDNACGKPVSLAAHASTVKALSDALKTLVTLERQAFYIGDEDPKRQPASGQAPASPPDPRAGFEDLRAAFQRVLGKSCGDKQDGAPVGLEEPGSNR